MCIQFILYFNLVLAVSRVYEKRGTLKKLTYLEQTRMHIIIKFIALIILLISPSYALTADKNSLFSTKSVLSGYSSKPSTQQQMFYFGYVNGVVWTAFAMNYNSKQKFGERIFCSPDTLSVSPDMLISLIEEVMSHSEGVFKVYEETKFDIGALEALKRVYPCE